MLLKLNIIKKKGEKMEGLTIHIAGQIFTAAMLVVYFIGWVVMPVITGKH